MDAIQLCDVPVVEVFKSSCLRKQANDELAKILQQACSKITQNYLAQNVIIIFWKNYKKDYKSDQ